jgi:polyhydroxyalkanoate synthesis regulator phasin
MMDDFKEIYQKKYENLNPLVVYNTSNLTKTRSTKSFATKLVNLISPDDIAYELFENGTKTNSEILDEYLVKLKVSRWENKIVIIELSNDTSEAELIATISKVKMFIDFQRKTAENIVIPIFSNIDKKFKNWCELELQLEIYNNEGQWSFSSVLDKYITKGKLSQEGHDVFSKKLLHFLLENVLNIAFEKRDDMRIKIFDIEQQLFKIHNKKNRELLDGEVGDLEKQILELKNKVEEKDREIFRETSLRIMTSKKLEIQKTIVKNNYPDKFKQFDSLKQEITALNFQNADLKDNLQKFREENSKLQELNPKKPLI